MAKPTRILSEQLEYVCAQRNLTLARRALKAAKAREDITEEEMERAQASFDRVKAKADLANANIKRAGLSKGSI
jgi:hypothetical protein